jgi:1,4-dihydroxy-2-naphthoate octaprenyltransferase
MKYKALGEVVIFIVFGPLLLAGAAFVQTGVLWSWPVLYVSIPVGIATSMVLFGNNIRDLSEDSDAGITTLARLLGKAVSRVLFVLGVLAPPLTVVGLVIFGNAGLKPGALACLISLLPVALLLKKFLSSPRLPDIDARVAQCAAIFMVTLLVGVMVSDAM